MSYTITLLGSSAPIAESYEAIDASSGFAVYDPDPEGDGVLFVNGTQITGAALPSSPETEPSFTLVGHGFNSGQLVIITGGNCGSAWADAFSSDCGVDSCLIFVLDDNTFRLTAMRSGEQTSNIHLLEFRLGYHEESEESRFWGGGYRKLKKFRSKYSCVVYPRTVRSLHGSYTSNVALTDQTGINSQFSFHQFMQIIQNDYVYIIAWDSEFERVTIQNEAEEQTYSGDDPLNFQLPIQVELFSLSGLAGNYNDGITRESFVLVSTEWFNSHGNLAWSP